ncbi:sodium-coupled monocarboxylate transporter 2-like [Tribolium castaneum]|uniref:sodium-coupled monocarboxylate transporter 2-like n=1 Tax=Tribolium castaneum TaxID=7070 RepID=UPI0001758905|nr:PREDICTED: sodium-coupled monocarboxylate transporter 2-like isoform X2 [Tribolium castaneum]|eukprot:XP_015839650.1 PREDICTED: sodium-coupled monocarboxylate transporter 2-like isoform X2 [Tribolium castaneum]
MSGFFWYDYLIFFIVLAISSGTGIYYGCFGSKQKTIKEYLLGGKNMATLPIGISVAVSHFSAITIMGAPSDIYKYGAFYTYSMIGLVLLGSMAIFVFFPVFFKLQVTSIYEYLEKRFDHKTKVLASFLFIVGEVVTVSVGIYAPSLALSAVTGIHVYYIILCVFGTCIFYTTIGGLKTVIWTDIFQVGVIFLSLFIICAIGLNTIGNFSTLWKTALDGGRLNILNFDLDPTLRDSFWTFVIGFTFHLTYYVSLSQSAVQKYLALSTFRDWVWAVIYYVITMEIVQIFCILLGLLAYAHYANCDPFISGKIQRHEQLLPYYTAEIAGHIPGATGFTLVGLFCATMSTISSSLNAISGVVYKDFLSRYLKSNITEKTSGKILRVIVVITGIVSMLLILVLQNLGDVLPVAVSGASIGSGPILGVFFLGFLFPKANAKGAFYGAIVSFIFQTFVFVVSKMYRFKKIIVDVPLPFSVSGCWTSNNTLPNSYSPPNNVTINSEFKPLFIFRLSHYYNCVLGLIVTVIVGLIISYLTNKNDPPVDKELISPVIRRFVKEDNKTGIENREIKALMTKEYKDF